MSSNVLAPVSTSIHAGTMMIQEGLLLPQGLGLMTDGCSKHWRSVKDLDSFGLARKIRETGWHLFSMAGRLTAIVLGRGGTSSLQRGVERIAAKVRDLNFNCFGVAEIAPRRFLGIPYVLVQADSYHIQKSCVLDSVEERRRIQNGSDWACG